MSLLSCNITCVLQSCRPPKHLPRFYHGYAMAMRFPVRLRALPERGAASRAAGAHPRQAIAMAIQCHCSVLSVLTHMLYWVPGGSPVPRASLFTRFQHQRILGYSANSPSRCEISIKWQPQTWSLFAFLGLPANTGNRLDAAEAVAFPYACVWESE